MRNKKGEWLLVSSENYFSLQPEYCCSVCKNMISTYYPPDVCKHCGSINEDKGNSISVSIEEDDDGFIVFSPNVLHDKATLEAQKDAIDEINDLLNNLKV